MNARSESHRPAAARARGFSLVELMITLILGLLVIEGVLQVYYSNRNAYVWVNAHSRQQESLRFAVDTLSDAIRNASYQGCGSSLNRGVRNVLNDSGDYDYDFGEPFYGYTGPGAGTAWSQAALGNPESSSTLYAITTGTAPEADPASDIVTVRGRLGAATPVVDPDDSGDIRVFDNGNIDAGELVMVSDCENSIFLQVVSTTAAGGELLLDYGTGGSFTPGNNGTEAARATNVMSAFGQGSEVAPVATVTYYVSGPWDDDGDAATPPLFRCWSTDTVANGRAVDSPGLCRVTAGQIGWRVIDGVERLKGAYGVSSTSASDRAVGRYVSAATATTENVWDRVVAVKLGVLLRSGDEIRRDNGPVSFTLVGGTESLSAADKYMRRTINHAVAIRNNLP